MKSRPPFFAQEQPDACALACLRMVLAFQKLQVSEEQLRQNVSLTEGGVDPGQLAQLAGKFGLQAEAKQLDLDSLKILVEQKRYPIVLVDRTFFDRVFTVHAVIPCKFSKSSVTLLDPLRGLRRLNIKRFQQALERVGGWSVLWTKR